MIESLRSDFSAHSGLYGNLSNLSNSIHKTIKSDVKMNIFAYISYFRIFSSPQHAVHFVKVIKVLTERETTVR